jgi:His/Glu/Gln/Arg/opine family amino acid ABC transporter permease subunit
MIASVANYNFDWSVIPQYFNLLIGALGLTFQVSIAGELVGLLIGLVVAFGRLQKSFITQAASIMFIETFRSVPLLVLLIWLYYGVSIVLGIDFSAFSAGVLGLGLLYGANLAEVFRAGIQAVPPGQREAALTLGLNRWQATLSVVLPQAIRIVIPALANSYVSIFKDATLISVLGLSEMMRTAQTVVAVTFRPFEIYTFVAIVYLVLTLIFGRGVALLERRVAIR